jgi:aflatoxin B1 aldehyde reductase
MGISLHVGLMGSSAASGATALQTPEGMRSFLSICSTAGITHLDTARAYAGGSSESTLGDVSASSTFAISTKAPAFTPHSLAHDAIIANCDASLKALRTDKVDIYYLHGPDRATPLEEQCRAIGELYALGRFERFGVCNISPVEVRSVYEICAREGFPLPKVYQGGYNPIGRGPEGKGELFDVLKELGMGFYAFSPLAGGLLAKPVEKLLNPELGTRFEAMKVFGQLYLGEETLGALKKVQGVCDREGISLVEATLRWFRWHSVLSEDWEGCEGNAVIVGASSEKQLEQSLKAWQGGRLPESVVLAWEEMAESLRGKMPPYHN